MLKFLSVIKLIWKPLVLVLLLILALSVFQGLGFNVIDMTSKLMGFGSKMDGGTVIIGQELRIPAFEITSLRINYLNNVSWREIDVFDPIRVNVGKITVLIEFDSYATLGMRNPETIRIQGIGSQVFVDKSSIIIEVLDAWVTNYKHIGSFGSNPFLQTDRYVTPERIFEIQSDHENDLKEKIITNSSTNFALAKENFMLNYELLCMSMGLQVVWAEDIDEFNRLITETNNE